MVSNTLKRHDGFTLLEVVVAMAILSTVLMISYTILSDTLMVSDQIDQITRPDKVGEAIMALFRRDIQGTLWYSRGDEIFLGENMGEDKSSHDELHFFTSSKPIYSLNQDDLRVFWSGITSISYVLQDNSEYPGCYTLFRRESIEITEEPFAEGTYFEVYDKVMYLEILYFDGYEWVPEWDSVLRLEQYQEELDVALQGIVDDSRMISSSGAGTGAARTSGTTGTGSTSRTAIPSASTKVTGTTGSGTPSLTGSAALPVGTGTDMLPEENLIPLPDHGIPRAVRIVIGIAVGDERGLYKETMTRDSPVKIFEFSATVSLPSAVAARVSPDVSASLESAMESMDLTGAGPGALPGGGSNMGPGGISGTGLARPGAGGPGGRGGRGGAQGVMTTGRRGGQGGRGGSPGGRGGSSSTGGGRPGGGATGSRFSGSSKGGR